MEDLRISQSGCNDGLHKCLILILSDHDGCCSWSTFEQTTCHHVRTSLIP